MKGAGFVVLATFVGWIVSRFLPAVLDDGLARQLQLFAIVASAVGAVLWLLVNRKRRSWMALAGLLIAALVVMALGQNLFSGLISGEPDPTKVPQIYASIALIFVPLGLVIEALGLKLAGGDPSAA